MLYTYMLCILQYNMRNRNNRDSDENIETNLITQSEKLCMKICIFNNNIKLFKKF